ncbi:MULTISPECIES: TIGR01777 family oxidoreductase [Actinomadura]|uniref:TIGR01777 family protein n=1 Tax=Actinomadura litoris TaxID=2678616 RepID=A0A7K1L795_9ACTN|nr:MULTISPECIES: TIGR01777 family oxidoreductase [Actinomadura]MBT2209618.1 TIGR01777 family oxidoreductase [Actinomadura sp. NEAU-AAG7]MUN40307.1 TIGR01777 family protein [Actinomadura litoris]
MKVTVTGSSGLIGGALVRSLRADGHDVLRLVRREPAADDEARWSPADGCVDRAAVEGADAIVHLAGAGLGDRPWTSAYKRRIRDSRLDGTRSLAQAIAAAGRRPPVLVSGSAIGYYGDTGGQEADEKAGMGRGFLAGLVRDWEAAAEPAREVGVRVVHPRTGVVLARSGGLLGRTLPLFRLGLGGRLGDGRQWTSWISLDDQVAALRFLIDHELSGPVNLTAPNPVTNAEYTRALGAVLRRPARLAVPRFALRAVLGGFADEGPLISQRVLPRRLEEAGFRFAHTEVGAALEAVL